MADAASGKFLGVYKATYAYAATGEDEVDMEEDQLVILLERSDDDWAKVRIKSASQDLEGPEGLVPAAYIEKAQPLSTVKAAYDYAATAPGELSVTDGQLLHVHERPADDDWILVESKDPISHDAAGNTIVGVGYVPANYVEEADGEEESAPAPAASSGGGIVIPDSPPRPKFTTPEDLVAASKAKSEPGAAASSAGGANAKNDPIQTWSVSHLDKKGKKKKGTLGVGNGAVFFASEADKTPVQKWQTSTITSISQEKSKQLKLDFQSGESLQFVSKDSAEAILQKLESSRALSTGASADNAEIETDGLTPRPSIDSLATTDSRAIANPYNPRAIDAARSVRFAAAPLEIPARADTPEDEDEADAAYTNGHTAHSNDSADGESAVALYDFEGDATDELSVREGEALIVLDRSNDDWWKCRNSQGTEGVVPAQYVDLEASDGEADPPPPPAPPALTPAAPSAGANAAAVAAAAAAARSQSLRAAEPEPEQSDDDDSEEEREREREREREKKEKKDREKRERRDREEAERTARAEEEERITAERKKAEEKKARAAASAREAKRQQEAEAAKRREKEDAREKESKEKRKPRTVKSEDEEDEDDDLAQEARKIALRRQIEKDTGQKGRPTSGSSRQGPPPTGKTRVWHDRSGQFRVEAEFKGFENGKIRLHKLNGVTIEVPSAKMSPEDLRYIAKVTGSTFGDDDDEPVAKVAQLARASPTPPRTSSRPATSSRPDGVPKKHVDWFEFFLNAGCDMDDCTRYTAAFERDKIDEAILPDMKSDTLRALGLREGDIIRVNKAIEKRNWTARSKSDDPKVQEQMAADQMYAQQVQEALLLGKQPPPPPGPVPTRARASPAPNLFAGPGGTLKDNTRRGRPAPAKSTSINVDENMLASASSQLGVSPTARTSSGAGNRTPSPNLLDVGSSSSPVVSKPSGFDDDAWTVRPSSTNPTQAAAAAAVRPPSTPASAPPAPAPPVAAPLAVAPPARPSTTSPTTAALSAELELLQKIAELKRPPSAPAPHQQAPAPPPVPSPSFAQAPSLQPQQTGFYGGAANGVRGPFAPVPANAPVLLQPLIPTNTGMVGFVPTRTGLGGLAPRPLMTQATGFQMGNPSFQPQMTGFQPQQTGFQPQQTGFQPQQTGFLPQVGTFQPQPTGFQSSMLNPQPTGYNMSGLSPLMTQQTGMPYGFRSTPSPIPPVPPMPSQFNPSPTFGQQSNFSSSPQPNFNLQPNSFNSQPIQTQPLGSLGFGGPPSNSPPPSNHAPVNVFASMKSGNFGGDEHATPNAPNYDALRQNPGVNQLTSQPTGWVQGYQYR